MGVIILDKAQEIYVKHITLQKEPELKRQWIFVLVTSRVSLLLELTYLQTKSSLQILRKNFHISTISLRIGAIKS